MKSIVIMGAALGLIPTAALADDGPFTIAASARLRVESIDGQFRPNVAQNDTMVSFKAAVEAVYDAGPVRFGAEVWDARSWGQDMASSAGTTEVNALELVQANVQLELGDKAKSGNGLLTLGRFTVNLGGRRMVSRQRFRNTTNAFTGAHLSWTAKGGQKLDLLYALPLQRLPDDAAGIRADRIVFDRESTDLMFFGAHGTLPRALGGLVETYAFGLIERDSPSRLTRNRRIGTVGLRSFHAPAESKWDHDVEAAYQFGKARRSNAVADVTDLDVSAWMFHAEVARTLSSPWKPRLVAMFDAASGDGGKAGRFSRFDTLYGARRYEFGPTAIYGPFTRTNIISPSARFEVTPSKRTDAFVAWRTAWAQNTRDTFSVTGVRDASGASGRLAGHQIEARVRHWIVPGVLQVDTGGAVLIKRGLLRDAPNAPATGNTRYGYVDLLLTL